MLSLRWPSNPGERLVLPRAAAHVCGALALAGLLVAGSAEATSFTLGDRNASAQVNTEATDPDGSGMLDWSVEGTPQLFEQWFYLRVGDAEFRRVDAFGLVAEAVTDTNPFVDDRLDTLAVRYGDADKLFADLTSMGARNVLRARNPSLIGKQRFQEQPEGSCRF